MHKRNLARLNEELERLSEALTISLDKWVDKAENRLLLLGR